MITLADLWAGLDVRHLAAFQAVARTESFARAARELGYTQPAVSAQIASLERLVGHRLFERSSGRASASLTPAGTLLLRHVETVAARLATARADLEALAAGDRGTLRVGAFQSVSGRIVPTLVRRLATSAPAITVELVESADEDDLHARLAGGELDFAFTLLPVDGAEFEAVELLRDPYYLVGPSDGTYPVAIESLGDLAETPLVAPRTCRSVVAIADQLRAAGIEPNYAFRTDDNFALQGLVKSGVGVALVTQLTLETLDDDLAAFPVDHLIPPRRIALTWSRHRTLLPLHELFVGMTREVCDELAAAADAA